MIESEIQNNGDSRGQDMRDTKPPKLNGIILPGC